MSAAQGWVALGILLAYAGVVVTVMAMIMNVRSEMSSQRTELGARIEGRKPSAPGSTPLTAASSLRPAGLEPA